MGVGENVGGFRLVRELGSGGFGSVYLGQDARGRQAAIKLLHPQLAKEPEVRRYFSQELVNARRVQGFCLAQVLDGDADAERPWIATEYIDGPTLAQAIRDDGRRTGGDLQRLAVQTITALMAIHAAGVVHRDLKPANILLAADGPRVIDFGIARALDGATSTPTRIGTLGYMAPEQIEGTDLGPAADVFAWGAVIIHAATGAQAFPGPTQAARINQTLNHPPQTRDLADPLLGIVLACTAKDPEQRPTARQVLDMLLVGSAGGQGFEDTGSRVRPEASSDDSSEELGKPEEAELVIGNLSAHPMEVAVDGTVLGTVSRFASGAFPVAPGERLLLVRAQGRGVARRITVVEDTAVRLAFDLPTGSPSAPKSVEEVVFTGSARRKRFEWAGWVAFGTAAAVWAFAPFGETVPLEQRVLLTALMSLLFGCLSFTVITPSPPELGLSVKGLKRGKNDPIGQIEWGGLEQVSVIGEGRDAQVVVWPRGDRPPMPGSEQLMDHQGGKVICVAERIRVVDPLQAERLCAALRWFAGDLWVEQSTAP
ncbi:serine/threonine-protein kinase [Nocardiopsis dassonvillei]|uniref:serine/threonine-protein kinase n=1 Tax=Nocardiopsis dassonvillei TaxID=2014 RepID=UPI00366C4DBA